MTNPEKEFRKQLALMLGADTPQALKNVDLLADECIRRTMAYLAFHRTGEELGQKEQEQ